MTLGSILALVALFWIAALAFAVWILHTACKGNDEDEDPPPCRCCLPPRERR